MLPFGLLHERVEKKNDTGSLCIQLPVSFFFLLLFQFSFNPVLSIKASTVSVSIAALNQPSRRVISFSSKIRSQLFRYMPLRFQGQYYRLRVSFYFPTPVFRPAKFLQFQLRFFLFLLAPLFSSKSSDSLKITSSGASELPL